MVWRLLAAADAVLIAVFAVAAATDPNRVLDQQGVDLHRFQGLLPIVTVVALRAVVLAAERRLLPVARGRLVLAERLASVVGFYYAGVWLSEEQYGRPVEVLLGGTIGYALVGVAGIGLAAVVHAASRLTATGAAGASQPGGPAAAGRHGGATAAAPPQPYQSAPPAPGGATPEPPTSGRRAVARESLLGLVGVFVGIAGLVMSVSNVTRIVVAILVGGVVTVGIALLTRSRAS